jgi:hypothetical protein
MDSCIELRDFRPDGKFGSEATDEAVIGGFEIFLVSYNAEAAFCGFLGVACEIAIQRPHLFKRLLPTIIDPACCMGVESAEGFMAYARALIERDAEKELKYQQFSSAGVQYFHHFITGHTAEIQRILEK